MPPEDRQQPRDQLPLDLGSNQASPEPNLGDVIRGLSFLEPAQIAQVTALGRQHPNPQALARELIQRKWLTAYQANQLLRGRGQDLLLGPYLLLERLGAGGMGQVFKARHQVMRREVALKVIHKDRLRDPEVVRRFQREIRAAAQVDHPNIVRALDAGQAGDVHYLVMEYVEGRDLKSVLKEENAFTVARACDYVRQAALGLQHAHQKGLVHRDIKPANMLLTVRDEVKLLDLGLARVLSAESGDSGDELTQDGAVMGTPDFIAPEQAEESHSVDIRADIYSLGCTLYAFLVGRPPFAGGSLMQKLRQHQTAEPMPLTGFRTDIPEALAALVRRMMAKNPRDRFQTPGEVAAALAPFAATASPVAVALPVNERDASTNDMLPAFARAATQAPARPPSTWVKPALVAGIVTLAVLLALLFILKRQPRDTVAEADPPRQKEPPPSVKLPPEKAPLDRVDYLVSVLGEQRVHLPVSPHSLALDPTGAFIALGRASYPVALGDQKTLRPLGTLPCGAAGFGWAMAFSPDGGSLAVACRDDTLRVYDPRTRSVLWSKRVAGQPAMLAWTPGGKELLVPSKNSVLILEGKTGTLLREYRGHTRAVNGVAAAPDGVWAASCAPQQAKKPSSDDTVQRWRIATAEQGGRLEAVASNALHVGFDPGRNRLLGTASSKPIETWAWDLTTGKATRLVPIGAGGNSWSFYIAEDGRFLLGGTWGTGVYSADGKTRLDRNPPLFSPSVGALLPDGKRQLLSDGGTVRLFRLDGQEEHPPKSFINPVRDVHFLDKDQTLFATALHDHPKLWRLSAGKEEKKLTEVICRYRFAYSPSGRLAVGVVQPGLPTNTPILQVLDIKRGQTVSRLPTADAIGLAFAGSDNRVWTVKKDGHVKQWDVSSGKATEIESAARKIPLDTLDQVLVPTDEKCLACVKYINGIRTLFVWKHGQKEAVQVARLVSEMAFADGGKTLIAGTGTQGTTETGLTLIDLTSKGKPASRVSRLLHYGPITAVAASPDGKRVVSADGTGTMILWARDGLKLNPRPLHEWKNVPATTLRFASDSETLAAGLPGGVVYVFRIPKK